MNRYDDRPMWEINKGESNMQSNIEMEKSTNVLRPKLNMWDRSRLGKNGNLSELYVWYHHHDRFRHQKKENEIDINEIKAALCGIKNRWTNVVAKNVAFFKSMIESKKYDWNKFVELLNAE